MSVTSTDFAAADLATPPRSESRFVFLLVDQRLRQVGQNGDHRGHARCLSDRPSTGGEQVAGEHWSRLSHRRLWTSSGVSLLIGRVTDPTCGKLPPRHLISMPRRADYSKSRAIPNSSITMSMSSYVDGGADRRSDGRRSFSFRRYYLVPGEALTMPQVADWSSRRHAAIPAGCANPIAWFAQERDVVPLVCK